MDFAHWIAARELREGFNPLSKTLTAHVQRWIAVAHAEGRDIRNAVSVLQERLRGIFCDLCGRPTTAQVHAALATIARVPVLGALVASTVSPIPGSFLGLLALNYAFKRVLGVSLLPRHVEGALGGRSPDEPPTSGV